MQRSVLNITQRSSLLISTASTVSSIGINSNMRFLVSNPYFLPIRTKKYKNNKSFGTLSPEEMIKEREYAKPKVDINLLPHATPFCFGIKDTPVFSPRPAIDFETKDEEGNYVKMPRTWRQIWHDLVLREYSQARSDGNGSERNELRRRQMEFYLTDIETQKDRLKLTNDSLVYVKLPENKDYFYMTLLEANNLAASMDLPFCMHRYQRHNPEKPERMAQIQDDGVPVGCIMDLRAFFNEAKQKDGKTFVAVVKPITIGSLTTGEDLLRKCMTGIDLLFEGHSIKFTCKSSALTKTQTTIMTELGLKRPDELFKKIEEVKQTAGYKQKFSDVSAALKNNPNFDILSMFSTSKTANSDVSEETVVADNDEEGNGTTRKAAGKKNKLSKKEIAEQKDINTIKSLSVKDKILYIALSNDSMSYPVLWEIVNLYTEIATIMITQRRLNGGKALQLETELPVINDSMSKRDRKAAELEIEKIMKTKENPMYYYKNEVLNAFKIWEEDGEIDPDIYNTMIKKNILIMTENSREFVKKDVVSRNSLALKIGKLTGQ